MKGKLPSMTPWKKTATRVNTPRGLALDRWLVRVTGSSFIARAHARTSGRAELPVLLLTTIHRKTGRLRTVVLPFVRDGDGYVVVGSHAGRPVDPIWARNLRTNPQAFAQIRWRRFAVGAREAEGAERDRLWQLVTADGRYLGYQEQARPRVLPLFVLHPN